jgi:hypothetical protein
MAKGLSLLATKDNDSFGGPEISSVADRRDCEGRPGSKSWSTRPSMKTMKTLLTNMPPLL